MVEVQISSLSNEKVAPKDDLGLFWSEEDTKLVGNFLRGIQPPRTSAYSSSRSRLWDEVKRPVDIETGQASNSLIIEANRLTSDISSSSDPGSPKEEVPFSEYEETVAKRSAQVLTLVDAALSRFGIWGADEGRRILATSAFREGKANFSEYEEFGEDIGSSYVSPSEGGPNIRSVIGTPLPQNTKNISDSRVRQSLAHEVIHNIRALANMAFWRGFEKQAERHWIRRVRIEGTKEEREERKLQKKNIGGFFVGSNRLGSEAIGELFALAVYYQAKGQSPSIKDVVPDVADMVKKDIRRLEEKMKKEDVTNISSYTTANVAMLQHLKELERLGFGDIEVADLVALGAFGYVSLEKMPALIKLGVMDQEKFKQMRLVVRNIANWLSSPSEAGFSFQSEI